MKSEWILICVLILALTAWAYIEIGTLGTEKAAACLDDGLLPEIPTAAPADPAPEEQAMAAAPDIVPEPDMEPEPEETPAAEEESGTDTGEEHMTYMGTYWVTGYDICVDCCGNTDGICASGAVATLGRTVAAGEEFPFGTLLYIEGIGYRIVEDRGGAVTNGILDVLCSDHAECGEITGYRDVYVVE